MQREQRPVRSAQRVDESLPVGIDGLQRRNRRSGGGVLAHVHHQGLRREGGRRLRADPQDLVGASPVGGRHVERAFGAHHRGSQPSVGAVELRDQDLALQRAGRGEAEDAQPPLLEERHREPAVVGAPVRARDEGAAARRQRRVAGRPFGRHRVGIAGEVGHGDVLVVAGHRIPPVVRSRRQQVDLVVVGRAVLHRPHLCGAGAEGEALHVAVAPTVDARVLRDPVARHARPGGGVHPQHLARQGGLVLRVRSHGGIAGADPQVAGGVEPQPAPAVAAVDDAAEHR